MEQTVQIFKALSEEIRLRMLLLLTHGELCVCDLMAAFGEPQSKISRHLAYLKQSGLVKNRRVGTWMHYYLNGSMNETARAQLTLLINNLSKRTIFMKDRKRLEAVLRAKGGEPPGACSKVSKKRITPPKNQGTESAKRRK
jgi:ArsR family transcriptional regulator